jgi:hypothetical protein
MAPELKAALLKVLPFAVAIRRCLAAVLCALLGCACVSTPAAATRPPPPAPHLERPRDLRERVEVRDTLPTFIATVRRKLHATPEEIQFAWQQYENAEDELLQLSGARARDPNDAELRKLAVSADAVMQLVQGFDQSAPRELDALVDRMATGLGQVAPATVAFAVSRSPKPFFEGELEGKPLLLFNARAPELADPAERQALMARALARVLHRYLEPDSPSLPPLAARLWREGACALATRQLVPDAFEPQLLGISEDQLAKLRAREALSARELLAALDSVRDSELARFFDAKVKDPLVPRGAGPFLADRLFQRLAAELGSGVKPLQLPPGEFLTRARKHLSAMASAKP